MKDPQDLTVGKFLQQERERKGFSLEAVAKVTRISLKSLEALEGNDFISLPAPIFTRSFLKTYASFLGLNPDKAIAMYETQTGMIGVSSANEVQAEKRYPRRIFFIAIPLLIVLIGGGIYWYSSPRKGAESPPLPSPAPPLTTSQGTGKEKSPVPPPSKEAEKAETKVQSLSKPEARPLPTVSKPSPPPSSTSAAADIGLESEEKKERRHILRVQAREQTWMRVQTDDQPEFEVLLEPKEKAVWTARRDMKITLGNAGGVDMTFNGKKVRAFGTSGQVVHLNFPQDAVKKSE